MKKLSLALLMTSFTMTSFLSPALAESQPSQNASAQQSQHSITITDSELRDFITSSKVIDRIRKEAIEKLNNGVDEETARIIQQQATENMIKAVEKTGLSVDSYNQIAQAMHSDEKLRQRANELN